MVDVTGVSVVTVHTVCTPLPDWADPEGHVYVVPVVKTAAVVLAGTSQLPLASSVPPFGQPSVVTVPAGVELVQLPLASSVPP